VKNSFTMTLAQVTTKDPIELKAALVEAVGSQQGADSIVRSLERLGTDASIEYFEMTEVPGNRRSPTAATTAWRVRADRGYQGPAED
jgi:hypothetical protein